MFTHPFHNAHTHTCKVHRGQKRWKGIGNVRIEFYLSFFSVCLSFFSAALKSFTWCSSDIWFKQILNNGCFFVVVCCCIAQRVKLVLGFDDDVVCTAYILCATTIQLSYEILIHFNNMKYAWRYQHHSKGIRFLWRQKKKEAWVIYKHKTSTEQQHTDRVTLFDFGGPVTLHSCSVFHTENVSFIHHHFLRIS